MATQVSTSPRRPEGVSRKRWRPVVAVAVAALATTGLAACSSSSGGGDASGGTTTLTLSMQNANIKQADPALYGVIQAFEKKYPTIKINVSGSPVDQHEQQLTVAAQSHTLPDMFWVLPALASTMQKNGNLLDMSPILKSAKLTPKFPPNLLASFNANGVQYGMPYEGLVTGFFVNKAILDKNNLAAPVTFDDLLNIARTLHKNGVTTISQGANQSTFSVWGFLTMLDRFGYEDKAQGLYKGSISYNNPDFLRLYQHVQDLAKAGAFPSNMTTQTYQQAVDAFTAGKAAMLDAGVWAAGAIQASPVGNDTTFWAGPTFSDGVGEQKVVMNVAAAPLAASAEVKKNKAKYDALTKFFTFYYSDAAQQVLVDNAQTPVTTYKPTGSVASQPVFASVIAAMNAPGWVTPKTQPDLPLSAAGSGAMYDSFYGVMQGVLSPTDAVNKVAPLIKTTSS
jgi:raffinose/stachyose/melibiose transport system substrate-binding protein